MGHTSVDYRKKLVPRAWFLGTLRRAQDRLYDHFEARFPPRPEARVLDLGVNASLEERALYFFEHRYPYKAQITAAGLETPEVIGRCYPEVRYVQLRRGEPLPFEDNAFDVVFSNAVIEHVGSREAQRAFLAEVVRVAKSGFVTTPNRWYPVEFHTLVPLVHYLPAPVYRRAFRAAGLGFFAEEENLNLLDRKALAALVPPGIRSQIDAHHYLGLPSNLLLSFQK